jgi:hypothetical protein
VSRWLAGLLFLIAIGVSPSEGADRLVPLAQPGPWSGVSGLIGYGDRLWLVNSVKFVDHNSADVYSYDPAHGTTRYEAHLFSQDGGDPVVARGLLYWPFEDPRFSMGRGEYMVTDGRAWQWRILPAGQVFHVHAMAAVGGTLFAATSAWRTGLQRSDDGGATWQIVYEHPETPAGIARITTLAVHDHILYAGMTAPDRAPRLLRLDGHAFQPVPDWPESFAVDALAPYRGRLYGVVVSRQGSRLWRTDGRTSEPAGTLDSSRIRALAPGPDALWAITAETGKGALWRSVDGSTWIEAQRFENTEPLAVTVYAARVYVGTRSSTGRGALWGPPAPAPHEPPTLAGVHTMPAPVGVDTMEALRRLDDALKNPTTYGDHGRGLRDLLQPLALGGAPAGDELSRRLDPPAPKMSVTLFGGALTVPAETLARWHLLWAIGLSGHGHVPAELLQARWEAPPNRAEKYLEPAPAAAWVAGRLKQTDDATVDALVARLGAPDQPAWMNGDLVGALTALTGQRFGYDTEAWRRWWASRQRLAR